MMNPYPEPNSVLVMDNARIHHGGRIAELAAERGIRILYLPPYSPDLNPIEKAFSVLKSYLRRTQILIQTAAEDKIDVIMDITWNIFSGALMHKLYAVCGYWI
jgi:transposase